MQSDGKCFSTLFRVDAIEADAWIRDFTLYLESFSTLFRVDAIEAAPSMREMPLSV